MQVILVAGKGDEKLEFENWRPVPLETPVFLEKFCKWPQFFESSTGLPTFFVAYNWGKSQIGHGIYMVSMPNQTSMRRNGKSFKCYKKPKFLKPLKMRGSIEIPSQV